MAKTSRALGMNLHEDIHALTLRGDETVLQFLVVSVSADELVALLREGRGEFFFHVALRGPARLVGGEAQIATGHQHHFIGGRISNLAICCCHINRFPGM